MTRVNLPKMPKMPPGLVKKGVVPAAFMAALSGPVAYHHLERWEGNIRHVYADKLAYGIPTYCAGRTDWSAPVGATLTSDECREVNKVTLLEYGFAVLACMEWKHLTEERLIAFTLFAVNVGKEGACGSRAARLVNAGNLKDGCDAMVWGPNRKPVWSYAGGRFVQGLYNRRLAERDLCLRGLT